MKSLLLLAALAGAQNNGDTKAGKVWLDGAYRECRSPNLTPVACANANAGSVETAKIAPYFPSIRELKCDKDRCIWVGYMILSKGFGLHSEDEHEVKLMWKSESPAHKAWRECLGMRKLLFVHTTYPATYEYDKECGPELDDFKERK